MAYRVVHQLLRRATKLLESIDGRERRGAYRDIVIKTNATWPTDDEVKLRDLIAEAVTASGIAEVCAVDAGDGSVSLWIRITSEITPEDRAADERAAARKPGGKLRSIEIPDAPPTRGDGTLSGFAKLLLQDLIDETEATCMPRPEKAAMLWWLRCLASDLKSLVEKTPPLDLKRNPT